MVGRNRATICRRRYAAGGHRVAAGGADRLGRRRFSEAVHGGSEAGDSNASDDTD
jgi:hypothetical protein